MKNKYLILAISLFSLIFISCNSSKKINNVRELMEDAGWEYLQRVVTDTHHNCEDNWIYEDAAEYDLFKRGNDYVLTRHDTDKIPLDDYETGDEHLQASYWINYYAFHGNYTIRADHAKEGTGHLGIITKHYNMMAGDKLYERYYFNINGCIDSSQSSEITEADSKTNTEENEEIIEPAEPQKKYKQCPLCYGNRLCGGCGGSGSVYNAIDYDPGQYVECSACGGTGRCGACEGSGMVEDFGW